MIKFVTLFLIALVASSASAKKSIKPVFTSNNIALQVRGGASLGPVDADLLSKVGSTSLALYMGGSASKFVSAQTGGVAPAITGVLTNDVISTVALVNAIATAAYFLCETGYGAAETATVLLGAVLIQKGLAAGGLDQIVDVAMANKVLAILFVLQLYVTYA